jgi:RNA binding exosome subunit
MRFAVVDLDKSEGYPGNFVSMLPMRIDSEGKIASVFTKFFGNKSLETARRLLNKSLKKKHSPQITAEIERRLNLLEPNPVIHIKCGVCKKFFKTHKETARKQKICPECMKRFDRQEK